MLREMCRSRYGLVVFEVLDWLQTFSATPVASQAVALASESLVLKK